jgi:hypothetical protein
VKACPAPKAPKNGAVTCSNDDYIIDTECDFSCLPGYTLVGSRHRSCLPLARWDGLHTTCKRESSASYNQINDFVDFCSPHMLCCGGWQLVTNTLEQCICSIFKGPEVQEKSLLFVDCYLKFPNRVYHKLTELYLHLFLRMDFCV